jgi:putative alpha-1,2-mannosidase
MFSIIAENNNDKNIYIQSASLNGAQLNHSFIRHGDIKAGGELKFIMGPEPNKTLWNSHESVPPSMSSSVQLSR